MWAGAGTLVLILVFVTADAGAGAGPGTGDACTKDGVDTRTVHIAHGGLNRSYQVFVPRAACVAGARGHTVPAVVHLHCFGCPCGQKTHGWGKEAARRGFVVVQPCGDDQGYMPSWNAGACCGDAVSRSRDDVGFIQAAVRDVLVKQRWPSLNSSRVYLTGFSNGGFMSSIVARRSTLFAAVAPAS